jgi:hypothetical protein
MRTRSLLATAVAAAALTAVPFAAQASSVEYVDRSTFDGAPAVSTSSMHLDGATSGELGGFLDIVATAQDGTLPTERGACDPVDVAAVLTVAPGEQLAVHSSGEVCMHQFADTLTLLSYFDKKDLTYSGTAHHKAKVVGDGMISAGNGLGFGFVASFSSSVRW